jgi:hypothetical protein
MQQNLDSTPQQGAGPEQSPDPRSGALSGLPEGYGDQRLFEATPDLKEFFDRGELINGKLDPGSTFQGYFVLDEYRQEPVLIWVENTSYTFQLPDNAAGSLSLQKGHPIRAVVTVQQNHVSQNEEGFDFIHRHQFDVDIAALEFAAVNPTLEHIARLPANVGFLVEGEIVGEDPVSVRTSAGHTLEFDQQNLPYFRKGVLEYPVQQKFMIGDHVRFTAARSHTGADDVVLHIPSNYQTTELLQASQARELEYLHERASRKLELIEMLNLIEGEQYQQVREQIGAFLKMPSTELERGYLRERIERMPEDERPVHPDAAEYLSSRKSDYHLEQMESEYGVQMARMSQSEFADLCESVSKGQWQGGQGRLHSIDKIYHVLQEIDGNSDRGLDLAKTHARTMMQIARDVDKEEGVYPDIALSSTTSILAYSGAVSGHEELCNLLREEVESGRLRQAYDAQNESLFNVTYRLVESIHQAVSQEKMSAQVLIDNEDTFHRALAAVFPREGYGAGRGMASQLVELRKSARLARAGYELALEQGSETG